MRCKRNTSLVITRDLRYLHTTEHLRMRRINALIILLAISFSLLGQSTPCAEAKKIVALLNREHVEPVGLNDSLSSRIFHLTFNGLDPKRVYFTETDFNKLKTKQYLLDEEIKHNHCHFINNITEVYKKRLESTLDYLTTLTTEITSFTVEDEYEAYDKDEYVFPKNDHQRINRVQDRVKLLTLYRLMHDYYQDSLTGFPEEAVTNLQKTKSEVIEKWICQINHILNHEDGYQTHIAEEYLNAITKSYDPHSAYFNKRQKKEFDLHLSRVSETFGLYIEEADNGNFIVSDLSPGGPAWKSNLIHEEDELQGITWPNGDKEEITCATEASINNLLNTTPFKTITLHLKKNDGKLIDVFLKKEILRVDENTIKSFVIHDKKNIGYLSIPSFYSDEGSTIVQGCANDVAKEVIKLKRENIDGLILDLRHNGGGSLREAIDFAGIFIDEGPICLMKEKNSGTQIVKDFNRGRIYTGPLVVLINGFSASASEILASSLQDYNRAVIVGSNSYGKATGQVIIPIDTSYNNFEELIGNTQSSSNQYKAYIKLTNSKFYRVNRVSNQKTGMIADIQLPSIWEKYHFTEKDQYYALKNDISNKNILLKKYTDLPLKDLKTNSNFRMMNDSCLVKLNNIATAFKKENSKSYSLNIDEFWNNSYPEIHSIDEFYRLSKTENSLLKIKNNASDAIFIEMDELIDSINNQIIDDLEKDVLIQETYRIISDLIDIISNQ